eukprot:COSAG05_NODE_727_length_7701_cov_13.129308_3_plen_79_part_00
MTAFDPEVVAPAERAAGFGCSAAKSPSVVVSIKGGPEIEISVDDVSHGVLPLIAGRTLVLSYHFGLEAPLAGRHHWEA